MTERVVSSPLGQFFSPVKKSTLEVLQNEVASLIEERDFFKSKYSSQMSDISRLEKELKSAQNQIAKLRAELISVEMERAKEAAAMGEGTGESSVRSGTCPSSTGAFSTGNDSVSRDESEDLLDEEKEEVEQEGVVNAGVTTDDKAQGTESAPGDVADEAEARGEAGGTPLVVNHEDDANDDEEDEDDVDRIRDHAAKMLIWANYQEVRAAQSTRRISTPGDASVASMSSARSSVGQVPRTIHASPAGGADAARASARNLLGLYGDEDDDDEDENGIIERSDDSESDDGSDDDEDGDSVRTPEKSPLDRVRRMLSPQF